MAEMTSERMAGDLKRWANDLTPVDVQVFCGQPFTVRHFAHQLQCDRCQVHEPQHVKLEALAAIRELDADLTAPVRHARTPGVSEAAADTGKDGSADRLSDIQASVRRLEDAAGGRK